MSDPNEPTGGHDPVDRAYAEAEAILHDDAERAARRARVLGAVTAAQADPEPVLSPAPPRRPMSRTPAPWLMAAGVAGIASLVGLRIAPTAVERPEKIEPAPAPTAPKAGAVDEASAPPPANVAPAAPAAEPPRLPPPAVQARSRAAAPMDAPSPLPPLPIPPVQARADAAAAPPPLPIPPVASRVETPAPPPPPPPSPFPSAARRLETPAAAAVIGTARGELAAPFRITSPDWARRPTDEDLAQYYPDRAQQTETSGSATISCSVKANGTLEGCTVVSETPGDYGFGGAALKLARIYRMKPKTADGAPVEGGTVRVPIEFRLPK